MIGRLRAIWRAARGRSFPPAPPAPAGPSIEEMLRLTTAEGHPNVGPLWSALKDLEAMRLNVKLLGYQLAEAHEYRLQAIPVEAPGPFLADSKPVTQSDIETRWFRYWCEQLRERPRYHRKLWEFAYLMQALHASGAFRPGARVLILGAAHQPTASYLAGAGAQVVILQAASDPLPGPSGDPLYDDKFVEKPVFERLVQRQVGDLSALPGELSGFDACISLGCAAERGSLRAGMDFLIGSVGVLKPGGVAAHIAEFNYADDAQTLDDWRPALFQRRHLEAVAAAWAAQGHAPTPLDFHVGHQALDRFVDIPPFSVDTTEAQANLWRDGWQSAHLKTAIDGFACTSFGLVVRRSRA
jgi:hypothetical protein